ncbi:hypothetical protein N8D21_14660 (plasmid) [Enterococcus faecium]
MKRTSCGAQKKRYIRRRYLAHRHRTIMKIGMVTNNNANNASSTSEYASYCYL